jgi:hypothetical protein
MNSSKTDLIRQRKTLEERKRLVARFQKSQMTQRDFAVRHGVGLSTLSKRTTRRIYHHLQLLRPTGGISPNTLHQQLIRLLSWI